MRRKILIVLLTMILVLTAVPQGKHSIAVAEASTNTETTNPAKIARNKQHSNINKKKKEYGVFLSIDASQIKKLYDYKEVVLYR